MENGERKMENGKWRTVLCSRFSVLCFLFSVSVLHSLPSQARMILPPQKETKSTQVAKQAENVFKGVCQDKKSDWIYHPVTKVKIPVNVFSFKVEEVSHGSLKVGEIVEVKQAGFKSRREAALANLEFLGNRSFEVGKKYSLSLGAPNSFGIPSVVEKTEPDLNK